MLLDPNEYLHDLPRIDDPAHLPVDLHRLHRLRERRRRHHRLDHPRRRSSPAGHAGVLAAGPDRAGRRVLGRGRCASWSGRRSASRCRSCCASSARVRPPDGWCPSSPSSPAPCGWRCPPTACSPASRSAAWRWSVSAPCAAGCSASLAGGLLLGTAVFLSYGLVLFGLVVLVPVVLTIRRRGWRAHRRALVGRVGRRGHGRRPSTRRLGFNWLTGLGQLRIRYYQGIAAQRPFSYFVYANLAAWLISCSPLLAVGIVPLDRRAQAAGVAPAPPDRVGGRGWRSPACSRRWSPICRPCPRPRPSGSGWPSARSRTPVSPCSVVGAPPGPWSAARRPALLVNHLFDTGW